MIYLDFDGVLNPAYPTSSEWDDWESTTVDIPKSGGLVLRFRINTSKKLAAALEGVCPDITWLTTWNQDGLVNTTLDPLLGWSPKPRLGYMEHDVDGKWWKWGTLLKEDLPEKWVWIDDDLTDAPDACDWAAKNGGFTIAPNPMVGLTVEHLNLVEEWLA